MAYDMNEDIKCKLFIGGISQGTTDEQLRAHFEEYFTTEGDIKKADVIPGKDFGFVLMATPELANEAIDKLGNNTQLNGSSISVKHANPPREKPRFDR